MRVIPISTDIADAVRKTAKDPHFGFSRIYRSCHRRCTLPTLPSHDFRRRKVDAIHLRRFRRHREAPTPWPSLCACGGVPALSRKCGLSGRIAEKSSGRLTHTLEAGGSWRRNTSRTGMWMRQSKTFSSARKWTTYTCAAPLRDATHLE